MVLAKTRMISLETLFSNPILFLVGFVALAISIGVHEFAHVLSAYLQGDQTGKLLGRLTLNPIRHLDPIGTIAMIMAGIGWGKPAPFNPYNLKYRRWGPAFVALAGPISNIVLLLLGGYILLAVGPALGPTNLLTVFLFQLVYLNAALAIFNLLPVFPLDGSHILEAVVGAANPLVQWMQRYGPFLLIALLFIPNNPISRIIVSGIRGLLTVLGLGQLI